MFLFQALHFLLSVHISEDCQKFQMYEKILFLNVEMKKL